jgi:hypothetical protein
VVASTRTDKNHVECNVLALGARCCKYQEFRSKLRLVQRYRIWPLWSHNPCDQIEGVGMRRRDFVILLAGAMGGRPSAVRAQQKAMPVHRFLRNGPPLETFMGGFRQGLREFGYVEGQNISIEYGLADNADQLPDAAAELVHRNVDVVIASGTPPVVAAKNATRTIPIVFVAAIDPIATGVVASLARPGGNVTGFDLIEADLMGKQWVDCRHSLPPRLSHCLRQRRDRVQDLEFCDSRNGVVTARLESCTVDLMENHGHSGRSGSIWRLEL